MQSLVVNERVPYWGPTLQRQFAPTGEFLIREAPHEIDLSGKVASADVAACIVVLEGQVSARLIRLLGECIRHVAVFVVVGCAPPDMEWALRELGAASILESPIPVSQMVRTLRRRLQSSSAAKRTDSAGDRYEAQRFHR